MTHTLTLGTLVTLNLLFGVLVQGLVILLIGPGPETDALFASLTIPQLLLVLTSGPSARVLLPLFSRAPDEATVQGAAWTLLQVIVAVVATFAGALAAAAAFWVPLLFPGFDAATRALTITLTRLQLAGVVLTAAVTVLAAFHQSRGRFIRVEGGLLLGTAVAALLMPIGVRTFGVGGAAVLTILQAGLQGLGLLRGLGRWQRPDWRAPAVADLGRAVVPLIAGALVYKNERTVDRWLASFTSGGNLSLLALAHQGCASATVLVHRVATAPLVPALARHHASGEIVAFRQVYRRGARRLSVITGALWAAGAIGGWFVLPWLPRVGGLTPDDLRAFWVVGLALGGYLVGAGCGQILGAAFYARGDTMTPTRVGLGAFAVSVPARALGLALWGAPGIALGSSLYHVVNAVILFRRLERDSLREARKATAVSSPLAAPRVP